MKDIRIVLLMMISSFAFQPVMAQPSYTDSTILSTDNNSPDYSNTANWAALPWIKDPSDSVPAPLQKNYQPDSLVDIFFIHPTTYTDTAKQFGWNAPVDDAAINKKTDGGTILYQASIFNEAGRVFAPRYRQANLSAYYSHDTVAALAAFDEAYRDVRAAFEYYMQHYNNGRPVIIASHSQGTTHAIRLMREFFDGTALQNKLVAAYLVGMAVKPDTFATITACKTPVQTGCICSWRTFKEDYEPLYVQKENFTAIVTNPLTWDADKPVATRRENQGSVLLNFNRVKPKVANAAIHDGVLWIGKPHFFGSIFLTNKNYHIADYNLFYLSVRQNAMQRVNAFWKE